MINKVPVILSFYKDVQLDQASVPCLLQMKCHGKYRVFVSQTLMEMANSNFCALPFRMFFSNFCTFLCTIQLLCEKCTAGSVDAFSLVWLTPWGKVRSVTISLLITVTMILGPPPCGLDCYAKVLVNIVYRFACVSVNMCMWTRML